MDRSTLTSVMQETETARNHIFMTFLHSVTQFHNCSVLNIFSCISVLPCKLPIKSEAPESNREQAQLNLRFYIASHISFTMKLSNQEVLFFMAAFVLLLVLLAPASEAAITCSDVIKDLRPCLSYLMSGSGKPPPACCAGIKSLASAAATTSDKQTACNCIKNTSKSVNVNPALAKALPGNCGITLPFAVSPNVDCSKIS